MQLKWSDSETDLTMDELNPISDIQSKDNKKASYMKKNDLFISSDEDFVEYINNGKL